MLDRIYWLGGSPCSGKSSIAEILAEQYSLQLFRCDYHFTDHVRLAQPDQQPALHRLSTMSWDEIWMQPVEALLQRAISLYQEEFPFILADLSKLAAADDRPILAEGAALMPDYVHDRLGGPSQAIWVVPTATFQRTHYRKRTWVQGILDQCADPDQAFQNWMDRDVAFATWVTDRAKNLGLSVLTVDGGQTIAENAVLVAEHFGLSLLIT